jgi:hypothetical protein
VSGDLDNPVARLSGERQAELRIRAVIEALHEQGIRASDIRCVCCHARLVDLAHIIVSARGPLCLECIEKSRTSYTPAPGDA